MKRMMLVLVIVLVLSFLTTACGDGCKTVNAAVGGNETGVKTCQTIGTAVENTVENYGNNLTELGKHLP